ncbi:MAG: response regulator [Proteobacteria bacterium]|nr:response regulator [Pseudomonadota bacterium]
MAHGGRIWCESRQTAEQPNGHVEFHFTLPIAAGQPCRTTSGLLRHSKYVTDLRLNPVGLETGQGTIDAGEINLEADICYAAEQMGRTIRVLVVDDESVYRSCLSSYLQRTPQLARAVTVTEATCAAQALAAVAARGFDLVITDVDIGADSLSGFELVQELGLLGARALTCVHSNRICAADHRAAIEAGADAFLPKPMARAQLLRLVLQAMERIHSQSRVWATGSAPLEVGPRRIAGSNLRSFGVS